MNPLRILHLSDLHIGNFKYDDPDTLAVKICDTLTTDQKKVDIVIVSGDIFDGKSTTIPLDRTFAIDFFERLTQQLVAKEIAPNDFTKANILFVPGNHDLVRKEGKEFEKYDAFIKTFYGKKRNLENITFVDEYNFFYVHPKTQVIVLGFNSCKIEIEKIKKEELKWIDQIPFPGLRNTEKIREAITNYENNKERWDDYGYLDSIEVDNLFLKAKSKITNFNDYTLIVVFHHHFYPFPEIVKKIGDTSLIRNYATVLDKFQREKVSIVLHGHKHLPIQRVVSDAQYFDNPNAVIYVFAAGSIGKKDITNTSFQWLKVFGKSDSKIAEGNRYEFADEEFRGIKRFSLPPQKHEEKTISARLLETLQNEDPVLYKKYKDLTDNFEQITHDNSIDKIIDTIGNLITIFNNIKLELEREPKLVFILLLCINYRVIFLSRTRTDRNTEKLNEVLEKIKSSLSEMLFTDDYALKLIAFISSQNNNELDKTYDYIMKNVRSSDKRIGAYASICLFFTDLFLVISKYGEYYFDKENLKHKINIALPKELFYNNIPDQSISIDANADRRAVIFNFRCNNPTVHKIAVLIVKDFEMRLGKFEESLKEINLKLYYIIPKVTPQKYELENFHFDAYIPNLLPLLTGDNLYQQKEVFIRELVQNSIDAILLRQRIFPDESVDDKITLEMGVEIKNGKNVKYFKIIDNGIGMSKFTIERYFTSIGRSFYVSEEFDELKKVKQISYQAISNFGIGFLSSFMVCREILVKTKSVLERPSNLEIEIPNYDGCFFIRNGELQDFGTEVTLYEDDRDLFDFTKFATYIKETFLNLELTINVIDKLEPNNNFELNSHFAQHNMQDALKNKNEIILFVPFVQEKVLDNMSWEKDFYNLDNIPQYHYGIYINFSKMFPSIQSAVTTLNQGLKISKYHLPFKLKDLEVYPEILINYPSSFIQLDVSREKVILFKTQNLKNDFGKELMTVIEKQFIELLKSRKNTVLNNTPTKLNSAIQFFSKTSGYKSISPNAYILKGELYSEKQLKLSLIKADKIPTKFDSKREFYFNSLKTSSFKNMLMFLETNWTRSFFQKNIDLKFKLDELSEEDNYFQMFMEARRRFSKANVRQYNIRLSNSFRLSRKQMELLSEDPEENYSEFRIENSYLSEWEFHFLQSSSGLGFTDIIQDAIEKGKLNAVIQYLYYLSFEKHVPSKKKIKQVEFTKEHMINILIENLMYIKSVIFTGLTIKDFENSEIVLSI